MKTETGYVFPWEREAMAGNATPEGLTYPDQMAFQQLRFLYFSCRQGAVDRETAVSEKKKIIKEYQRNTDTEEFRQCYFKIVRAVEMAVCEYRKNKTIENADHVMNLIDGIEKPREE